MDNAQVAVIGAGPCGVACARACINEGLSVRMYDRNAFVGGVWAPKENTGPVFCNLSSNTACFENAFSDIPPLRLHPSDELKEFHEDLCNTRQEMHQYLEHAVDLTPGLRENIVVNADVRSVEKKKNGFGYVIKYCTGGEMHEEVADKVIVATGRFTKPFTPSIKGIEKFTGDVIHAVEYYKPSRFSGKRVLVIGGHISGSEAACDVAYSPDGAASVTVCTRRMRYVCKKQEANKVLVSSLVSRSAQLARACNAFTEEELQEACKAELESFGKNAEHGIPKPSPNASAVGYEAGSIVSERMYLVAEKGKLNWIESEVDYVDDDNTVFLKNGQSLSVDAIIFATGYVLDFPFFSAEWDAKLKSKGHIWDIMNLHMYTWHPDLPGIAFAGLYVSLGPVVLAGDCHSRYIARAFADKSVMPTENEMRQGLKDWEAYTKSDKYDGCFYNFNALDALAKAGGFQVDVSEFPHLAKALLFGPMVPAQFRLCGHGKLKSAEEEFKKQLKAAAFDFEDNLVDENSLALVRKYVSAEKDDCIYEATCEGVSDALAALEEVIKSK